MAHSKLNRTDGPPFPRAAVTQITGQRMNHFNLWQIPSGQVVAGWYNILQRFAEETRLGIPVTIASDPRNHFGRTIFSMAATDSSQWCETLGFAAINDIELVQQFAGNGPKASCRSNCRLR